MTKESTWKWWRERLRGADIGHAAQQEKEWIAKTAAGRLSPELAREQAALEADPARAVRIGRFLEGPRAGRDLLVDVRDLLTHQAIFGASGSGKSFAMLLELMTVIERGAADSVIVLDMKGEIADLLCNQLLPALAAKMSPKEADALLSRVVVVDPFSTTHPPPLNLLVPDPGLSIEIQARDMAECFETATENDVTARMETILDWLLRLVIETKGTFLTVPRAIQEPLVLDGLVRQSQRPDTVRYCVTRFPSEPKASKLALLARLDRFLALPMTRLCLGADSCINFDALLKDRITIISLGNAPAGLQSVARFFAMVFLTRFVRAIWRLPARSRGFASVLAADEWQVALNPAMAKEFDSILTLARSRGVHLWLANQQLTQLDRQGTTLRSAVIGLTNNQLVFRMAPDDARSLKYLFPVTGTRRRHAGADSSTSPFLSPSEEMEARMVEASRLPNRVGYWLDRRRPWDAILMQSATLDLPAISSLPPSYISRAQTGIITYTVADLEAMQAKEEARLDALAAGPTAAAPVATTSPPATPTLLGAPAPKAALPARPRPKRRGAGP